MSKKYVEAGNSSTYNSSGVYVSDNTFEEIEDLGVDIEIDEDPLEIFGIFDFPNSGEEVEKWFGTKRTQLQDAMSLSTRITNLTSAERKKYDDHFDKTQNSFESSITEIDNIKGRYFLLENPDLLVKPSDGDGNELNPYLEYFEGEDSDWEGYNYRKNSYFKQRIECCKIWLNCWIR